MFGLFEKQGEQATAPAAPALSGDLDATISFEGGVMVLAGPGFRLRLNKESALLLSNKAAMAARFAESESPAHGPFGNAELKKVCEIARYLRHGLSLEDAAKIYGEKSSSIRAFYAYGLDQALFRGSSAADDEKAKLGEMDRVRSVAGVPGGTMISDGRLVSALTGVPIEQKFARLNAVEVSAALRANKDDTKDTAKFLKVDADDLARWVEANGEMLAVIR